MVEVHSLRAAARPRTAPAAEAYPKSANLVTLAEAATRATEELLDRAAHKGALRQDFTAADLYYADVANGLALRTLPTPSREE